MSFEDLFFKYYSGIFAQKLNGGTYPMPVSSKMPIKFKCTNCNKIYMHPYHIDSLSFYPACPDCKKAGLLLGTAEITDLIKYPRIFTKNLLKQISHKLNK